MNEHSTPVTLSKAERAILDFCAAKARGADAPLVSLSDVLDHFYPDGERPVHAPSAMARRLRVLNLKGIALGIPHPVRVSKVGRGNRAIYEWRGDTR